MRGDIYRLRPPRQAAGHEQRGHPYAVVLQSDHLPLSTWLVAPTSTGRRATSFRPEIEIDGRPTRVMVEQTSAVDPGCVAAVAPGGEGQEPRRIDDRRVGGTVGCHTVVRMDVRELLIELYDRIPEHVHEAVAGLGAEDLVTTPERGSNPIGWLVWHLTRVQDSHVAELLDNDQVWITGDWPRRFGLAADPANTGFGHTATQVAEVRPDSPEALIAYYDAVAARTHELLQRVSADDLDRVIDEGWNPPVTLGVRLVSVADDDIQHAGQATYLRGLLSRQRGR